MKTVLQKVTDLKFNIIMKNKEIDRDKFIMMHNQTVYEVTCTYVLSHVRVQNNYNSNNGNDNNDNDTMRELKWNVFNFNFSVCAVEGGDVTDTYMQASVRTCNNLI